MLVRFLTAGALSAAAVLVPAPTRAHEGGVMVFATLDSVKPQVRGLDVRVVQSVAPAIEVTNGTGRELVVLGETGEPFARLAAGKVQTNAGSPTTARAADPLGVTHVAARPGAGLDPEWRDVATGASWRWYDPRIRDQSASTWTIRMRLAESAVTATGRIVRQNEFGHFRTKLDAVRPQPRGLQERVLEGRIPALFVRNATTEALELEGAEGEPFLRIGPGGVEGNTLSPSYYLAGSRTVKEVPATADAGAEPQWTTLSPQPAWVWLEYRARVPGRGEKPFSLGPRPHTVLRWTSPATLGGEPLRIAGHVEWVPVVSAAGGSAWYVRAAQVGALLAVIAVAILIRRRLGGGSRSPAPAP